MHNSKITRKKHKNAKSIITEKLMKSIVKSLKKKETATKEEPNHFLGSLLSNLSGNFNKDKALISNDLEGNKISSNKRQSLLSLKGKRNSVLSKEAKRSSLLSKGNKRSSLISKEVNRANASKNPKKESSPSANANARKRSSLIKTTKPNKKVSFSIENQQERRASANYATFTGSCLSARNSMNNQRDTDDSSNNSPSHPSKKLSKAKLKLRKAISQKLDKTKALQDLQLPNPESKGLNNIRLNIIDKSNKETLLPIEPEKLSAFNRLCLKLKDNLTSVIKTNSSEKLDKILETPEPDATAQPKEEDEKRKEKMYRRLGQRERVIYDSLSDEEDVFEYANEQFVDPLSTPKIVFDFLVLFTTLVLILVVPIELIVEGTNKNFYFFTYINIFSDILFIIDLIVSFFTGYFNSNDTLITENKKIIYNYLSSWFFFDVIEAIPFGIYFEIRALADQSYKIHTAKEMLKFLKFLKLIKFTSNASVNIIYFHFITTNLGSHIIIILTLSFYFLIVHLLASVYIAIGLNDEPSWILANRLEPTDYFDVYIASFYFIFSTIFAVGYGDLRVVSNSERLFLLFLLLFGVLMYSWLVSTLSEYGQGYKSKRFNKEKIEEFKKKKKILKELKRSSDGNKEILIKAERYIVYNFNQQIFNSKEITDILPYTLKCELIEFIYRPIINNFVFFKNIKNRDFVIEVLTHFAPALFVKNERVLVQGDFVEEMIFVKDGKLSIDLPLPFSIFDQIEKYKKISHLKKDSKLPRSRAKKSSETLSIKYIRLIEIRRNEHYGDINMFLNTPTELSVRVTTKIAEVFLLKKNDAVQISTIFPDIWKSLITNSIHNLKHLKLLTKKVLDFFYNHNDKMLQQLYAFHDLPDQDSESFEEEDFESLGRDSSSKTSTQLLFSTIGKETNDILFANETISEEPHKKDKSPRKSKTQNFLEKLASIIKIKKKPKKEHIKKGKENFGSDNEQNESNVNLLNQLEKKNSLLIKAKPTLRKAQINYEINDEFQKIEEKNMLEKLEENTGNQSRIKVKNIVVKERIIQSERISEFTINEKKEEKNNLNIVVNSFRLETLKDETERINSDSSADKKKSSNFNSSETPRKDTKSSVSTAGKRASAAENAFLDKKKTLKQQDKGKSNLRFEVVVSGCESEKNGPPNSKRSSTLTPNINIKRNTFGDFSSQRFDKRRRSYIRQNSKMKLDEFAKPKGAENVRGSQEKKEVDFQIMIDDYDKKNGKAESKRSLNKLLNVGTQCKSKRKSVSPNNLFMSPRKSLAKSSERSIKRRKSFMSKRDSLNFEDVLLGKKKGDLQSLKLPELNEDKEQNTASEEKSRKFLFPTNPVFEKTHSSKNLMVFNVDAFGSQQSSGKLRRKSMRRSSKAVDDSQRKDSFSSKIFNSISNNIEQNALILNDPKSFYSGRLNELFNSTLVQEDNDV